MARKADLLNEARALGLDVSARNTIPQLEAALAGAETETETESTYRTVCACGNPREHSHRR